MKISAYIPCYNNAHTIQACVSGMQSLSPAPDELFVVDDGSTDQSVARVGNIGVRVVGMGANQGRGAVRKRAMSEAQHELVLCCDATNVLPPDFLACAFPWFADAQVAAVYGRHVQSGAANTAERWRGRHLYKMQEAAQVTHQALLVTACAIMRKSAVLAVGGFDVRFRHSEDAELGERLLAGGYDVVQDPALRAISIGRNTVFKVLERYWRWNTARHGNLMLGAYLRNISYSIKCLARQDIKAGDWQAALVSLACPHYQMALTLRERLTRRSGDS